MGQVTIGSDTFDIYGTIAGFATYMAGKVDSVDFDAATADGLAKAQVSAARWIDRENWDGSPTDPDTPQPLAFPRAGLTDCNGLGVNSAVTPTDVEDASYELANILLGDAAAADVANQGGNVKVAKAGSAQVTFFRPGNSDGSGTASGAFPPLAQKLLRCFIGGANSISGPTITGTSQASSFDDCDFRLNRGLS